ncbi:hypothetical protein BKP35_07740 [Anaerobacillus arseniciselenatis]|uniref:Uncharacterized protein n=1 Tax=Anaerobacillus arseniciselenatis TaxID=85682 RepID=A0A1S2LP11_9BACI|nr:hypothetical protein BKP35_07740 [Anaerobacillus arseniciselenatis]
MHQIEKTLQKTNNKQISTSLNGGVLFLTKSSNSTKPLISIVTTASQVCINIKIYTAFIYVMIPKKLLNVLQKQ